jgi:DNA replicative helicase MCM subunit Mcm2 (Cdc46/Mcm family)
MVAQENETYVFRMGSVPAAKGRICLINKISRMNFDDQKLLLDVMQKHFTINKRGISSTIASPTPIIAFVNPIDGHWRDTAAAPLRHDICCFITWGFIIKNRTIFHKE